MALDPDKITLCWPNYVDGATLSGGNYVPTLPLANAQDRRFAAVAKTASTDPADTQFVVTLPRRRRISCAAVPAHNFTSSAQIRVRVYRDTARTDLVDDSGMVDVWPVVYTLEDVIWGDDNFWNRKLSEEDRAAYTPLAIVFLNEPTTAEAVHVELFDEANPDGALTFGRAFVSDAWQPEYNASYGLQDGYDSGTEIVQASDKARTEYADRVTPKRTVSMQLDFLSEDEAFLRLHRLRRTQDIAGEVLYVFSTRPSPANFARTFMARQQSLDPITHPYFNNFDTSINLLEIL